jgi:4'-phosphopantetheinyl transferase
LFLQSIYYINVRALSNDAARLTGLLGEGLREKVAGCWREDDALRSLAGGLLTRRIANGKPVGYTDKGKPFVVGGPFFNVSHSGDYAAAVVSENAPVGIDIENTENDRGGNFSRLAERAFHPDELSRFNENPTRQHFYEIWTQKEAFVKMKGGGLGIGLKTFSVLSPMRNDSVPVVGTDGDAHFFTRLIRDLAPYVIAVCSAEPIVLEAFERLCSDSF